MERQPLALSPPAASGLPPFAPRELRRPWKLASFAAGMAWLLYGATHYGLGDWDVGISLLMGGLTYVLAPWSVLTLIAARRQHQPLWAAAALLPAWVSVDGSYTLYNTLLHHPMLRLDNFIASSALYFLAGIGWMYRGSLRQLWGELRQALGEVD